MTRQTTETLRAGGPGNAWLRLLGNEDSLPCTWLDLPTTPSRTQQMAAKALEDPTLVVSKRRSGILCKAINLVPEN